MDKLERISITGKCGLNLIETQTKNVCINNRSLLSIGRLLIFIKRYVFPLTTLSSTLASKSSIEAKYVDKFARQLGITARDDLQDFPFQAVSVLINRDLNPHCDSMNPTKEENDYTMALSFMVPTTVIADGLLRDTVEKEFPYYIPMCIVIYKRKCVDYYSSRMSRISDYISESEVESDGRGRIVRMLNAVNTDADFYGTFFNKFRMNFLQQRVVRSSHKEFTGNIIVADEAADKLAMWSPIIHVFLLYCHVCPQLKRDDVISFVLFFSHQCNTTVTFVSAMVQICKERTMNQHRRYKNLYEELAATCSEIRGVPLHSKDIGSGPYPRIQTSANAQYTDVQLSSVISILIHHYSKYTKEMIATPKRNIDAKLQLYQDLRNNLSDNGVLSGHRTTRVDHLICLSALVGLLPLDYYINVPMHHSGGPGTFLDCCCNIDKQLSLLQGSAKQEKILTWTSQTIAKLQPLFSSELTPNMLENICCIIGRSLHKKDVAFFLPWFDSQTKTMSTPSLQLCLHLEGYNSNDWNLQVFDGETTSTMLSASHPDELNKILYAKNSNGCIVEKYKHTIDRKWLASLFRKKGEIKNIVDLLIFF